VDDTSLPDWLGGKSHGSLLDDVGPWSDAAVMARLGLDVEVLKQAKRPPSSAALPPVGSLRRSHDSQSDGYASPSAELLANGGATRWGGAVGRIWMDVWKGVKG
jgi:hypothetical protein